MRNSISLRLSEYKSDPIIEYNKINELIHKNSYCYYGFCDIYIFFRYHFANCKLLRSHYVSFDACLSDYENNLRIYKDSCFKNLEKDNQINLLNDYLDYCELITYMHSNLYNLAHKNKIDLQLYSQLKDIIETGLRSMNYRVTIIDKKTKETRVVKINEEAEIVAAQSQESIKDVILLYLGTRDNNIEDKKIYLHKFIDLLEPVLKKYNNEPISSVREYVQLLRHPETKKNDQKYIWFYENESEYIDKLFSMCLFVQHYDITKKTLKDFDQNKTKI